MPTQTESANLAIALRYIKHLEDFAQPGDFEEILHPDILLTEFPNLLKKNGSTSDYASMVIGPQKGRQILSSNRYEVINTVSAGDWVTLEITWTGVLAIPLGTMAPGDEMKAHIATFLQFKDGRIIAQRQYDCYEPFPYTQPSA